MKILIIGDLHGIKPRIHFKNFDAIIFVGDVCSDRELGPLKNQWVKALEENPETTPGMDTFIVQIIGRRRSNELERDSLKVGRKILEYLNSLGKPVFMVPGNWDQSYGKTKIKDLEKDNYSYFRAFLDFWLGDRINPKLVKGLKNIKDCQYKLHKFNGFNMVGYGLSSNSEKPLKKRKGREYSKRELARLKGVYFQIINKLSRAYKNRDKNLLTIFITHNVPHNTPLDIIKIKDSKFSGKHFGSTVARNFCDKYQPLLCVGGHIHEHFKKCKIKKTVAINAGFGKDANVLIELDEKKQKIKKISFYPKYKRK